MNISITIMAHPKRAHEANLLLSRLSVYPFTQCSITWDQQNNEWHTGERALRAGVSGGGEWHIVLQDDAIIPDDFYKHVVDAISNVPDRTLISLYTGTVRPYAELVTRAVRNAKKHQASWIKGDILLWGVGIVIPTAHIEPMLEFVETFTVAYDIRIGLFYQRNKLPVFYTNPSLVDHNDDIGSLIGNDYSQNPRVAHNFIDVNVSWNNKVIDL